jgi:hypothetical protein
MPVPKPEAPHAGPLAVHAGRQGVVGRDKARQCGCGYSTINLSNRDVTS